LASLDLSLLKLFRTRDSYDKLIRTVPEGILDEKTKIILDDYGKFYREFSDVQELDFDSFWLWFKSFAHPKINDEKAEQFKILIRKAQEPLPPGVEAGLHERIIAADTANKLLQLVDAFQGGDEISIGPALRAIMEQWELDTNRKVKTPWVQDDIDDLLEEDATDSGFKFPLQELNDSMRPLRPGDFMILAARPDVGKTTALSHFVSHFAGQVDDLYPGEERTILWFNNEGPGNRILKRLYQSSLNATMADLVRMKEAGTVKQAYIKAMGGRPNIVRVFDIHDFWNHEVEDIIRATPPALIIFDMVDNIRFGGSVGNNGQRTDQLLEAMYQWARVLGVKHNCPIIATSQISADGENMCYPLLSMLKDSKTGKQGAADAILTIGYKKDFPSSRFLGLTKNKLARDGMSKSPKAEVLFDGSRGRLTTPREYTHADDPSPASEGTAAADPLEV
jgi:replicative DNA helicase